MKDKLAVGKKQLVATLFKNVSFFFIFEAMVVGAGRGPLVVTVRPLKDRVRTCLTCLTNRSEALPCGQAERVLEEFCFFSRRRSEDLGGGEESKCCGDAKAGREVTRKTFEASLRGGGLEERGSDRRGHALLAGPPKGREFQWNFNGMSKKRAFEV